MLIIFRLRSFVIRISYYFTSKVLFIEWEILSLNSCSLIITILFDWIRLRFSSLVIFISSMVLFYRRIYISGDKNFYRFIILVYLFVVSIIFLIISPNIISILIGWDGLGLVSYCLVIYYQNVKSANAGILTVLTNRIGDVAILLSISWLLNFGSWNFYYLQYVYQEFELFLVTFLVVLAAMTKRAQIPFSAWLPAAMAAPTPVSSLVHSSTLVTAGVYLLIRFNFVLGESKFLLLISVLTIFMSGYGANYEIDLKKIIALSTLSQLGVMIITLSLGFYELSFFHLITHALFKSLLFLCAGAIIHGLGDIQDIRYLGGILSGLPIISVYFIGSSLALCGFPFLAGFYSKDVILEIFFMGHINIVILVFIFLSTIFTLTYSIRLIYYLYFKNLGLKNYLSLEESSNIYVPIFNLFIISIFRGSFLSWLVFPPFLVILPFLLKVLVIIGLSFFFLLLSGVILNYRIFRGGFSFPRLYFGLIWFMPNLSTFFIYPLLGLGNFFLKNFDHSWVEKLSGQGVFLKIRASRIKIDIISLLNLKTFLFFFIFFLVVIFVIV